MTLLSLLFAAPATADTVTPVRHCGHGDGYRELDGDSSVVVSAPEGYLIVSYCVDGRGRRGSSEVRALSAPQRTTVVRHSDGRPLEGYSVEYTRAPAPEEPEEDQEESEGEQDESDEASQTAEAEAAPSSSAADEKTAGEGRGKKDEKDEKDEKAARTPSAAASEPDPVAEREPSPRESAETSAQPEDSSQMSMLSDGEELRITSLEEEDDDEDLRSLVVAGGIIIVGLLAGMIALLVRLPGQR